MTHNVKTFRFRTRNGLQIPFKYLAGQFLTLHIEPWGIPTKRSYTIVSTPTWRNRIEITVKREDHGLVSRWLHDEVKVGDELEIEAPNGAFFFTGEEADSVVLIGGGVGVTPMMSAARYLTDTNWSGKIYLILSFQAPRDFIFREELAELQARNANLGVTVTMSRPGDEPWSGGVGRIDGMMLASAVPDIASRRVHICGPPPMMDAVKAALVALSVLMPRSRPRRSGPSSATQRRRELHRPKSLGRCSFRLRTRPHRCWPTRLSLTVPTKPGSSSITPAAQERAAHAASSSSQAT